MTPLRDKVKNGLRELPYEKKDLPREAYGRFAGELSERAQAYSKEERQRIAKAAELARKIVLI